VSNIRIGSLRLEPAKAGKPATDTIAKANVETTDRRDIMVDLRFSLGPNRAQYAGLAATADYS
jgi:hypothetical protein